MPKKTGEITVQRLLEDFQRAEKEGELSKSDVLTETFTWNGQQHEATVSRLPGDGNFNIKLSRRRIAFLGRLKPLIRRR